MADVLAESMGGGTMFRRENDSAWDSQSLGPQPPLAKQAVLVTAQDIFVLDSAFALIEAHPASGVWLARLW